MKGRTIASGEIAGRKVAALIVDGQLDDLLVEGPPDRPAPGAILRAIAGRPLKGQGGMMLDLPEGRSAFLRQTEGIAPGQPLLVQVSGHAEPGQGRPRDDPPPLQEPLRHPHPRRPRRERLPRHPRRGAPRRPRPPSARPPRSPTARASSSAPPPRRPLTTTSPPTSPHSRTPPAPSSATRKAASPRSSSTPTTPTSSPGANGRPTTSTPPPARSTATGSLT